MNHNMKIVRRDFIIPPITFTNFIRFMKLNIMKWKLYYFSMISTLISVNLVVVAANVVKILIVPAIFPIITFLAICNRTQF